MDMPLLKRTSQRDLARIAKVSHTTISLALKNDPSISASLRKKIHTLASRHNYRPDPALAILNAYRTGKTSPSFRGNIIWLTNCIQRGDWAKMPQVRGYFEGARQRALELGYNLEEFWLGTPGLTPARTTTILSTKGARGLIVAPLPTYGGIDLDWGRFSAVALGYSLTSPKLHMVMNHQSYNMRTVIRQLCRLGYRRIGLAMSKWLDERINNNYLSGFLISQYLLPESLPRIPSLLPEKLNDTLFNDWFDEHKPDAVVTDAVAARDVMHWLKKRKLRIPRDVGLAVPIMLNGDPLISGINENVHLVGAKAVDAVVSMIHHNETGIPSQPVRTLVEGIWTPTKTISSRLKSH